MQSLGHSSDEHQCHHRPGSASQKPYELYDLIHDLNVQIMDEVCLVLWNGLFVCFVERFIYLFCGKVYLPEQVS